MDLPVHSGGPAGEALRTQTVQVLHPKEHVNEATPHFHDFPVIMNFFGGDYRNIRDFDAEIWFYLGGERQVITTPATISIPAGLAHCPLIFKRVSKPIAWVEIMLTGGYERREVDIPLIPDPGI